MLAFVFGKEEADENTTSGQDVEKKRSGDGLEKLRRERKRKELERVARLPLL